MFFPTEQEIFTVQHADTLVKHDYTESVQFRSHFELKHRDQDCFLQVRAGQIQPTAVVHDFRLSSKLTNEIAHHGRMLLIASSQPTCWCADPDITVQ
jgi:hypothetical protein